MTKPNDIEALIELATNIVNDDEYLWLTDNPAESQRLVEIALAALQDHKEGVVGVPSIPNEKIELSMLKEDGAFCGAASYDDLYKAAIKAASPSRTTQAIEDALGGG